MSSDEWIEYCRLCGSDLTEAQIFTENLEFIRKFICNVLSDTIEKIRELHIWPIYSCESLHTVSYRSHPIRTGSDDAILIWLLIECHEYMSCFFLDELLHLYQS